MRFFLDLEFTPIGPKQECLTIGVVKVNQKGKVVDTFYRVIRTHRRIGPGYKWLSHQELKEAKPFSNVCQELRQWLGTKGMVYCYDAKDIQAFDQDCKRHRVYNFLKGRLFDLQPIIMHDLKVQRKPGLEEVKKRLGSKQVPVLHHALVDAYDLMLIKRAIEAKQPMQKNPFYENEQKKQTLDLIEFFDWSSPLKYPPMVIEWTKPAMDFHRLIVKSTIEMEGIRIWDEKGVWNFWKQPLKDEQPPHIPVSDPFYRVDIQRPRRNLYDICYYKETTLILKVKATLNRGSSRFFSDRLLKLADYQVNYDVLTKEGQKIVESGLLGVHLNLTTRHQGYFLTRHTFGDTIALWCWISVNQVSKNVDRACLPNLKRPVGVIQSEYQYTPSGYLPTMFRVVQLSPELEKIQSIQTFKFPDLPYTKENAILFTQALINYIESCNSSQWFAIETKSLKIWVERAGGLKPRLIDLTAMERRMAIAMNQTFLYERKMLLRFANYLGFPIETATRWDQELEAYLHLIRYSKGFVVKEETPIVLERLTLQLSPWDQQLLMTSE